MKKKILHLSVMMALTASAFAQSADNFILPKHSIVTAADHFGTSVSKFDNYVLVGGPDDDLRSPSYCPGQFQMTGAVILYKDGQVKSTYRGGFTYAPDGITEVGWRFGQSVAMGAEWLAIGAPNYNIFKGRVFLVKKSSGEFEVTPQVTLDIPNVPGLNTSYENEFGRAVAMGRNILVIGAPRAMYNGVTCGAVFIYKLNNGIWSHVKTLVAPSSNVEGNFGSSVAISDDEQKVIVGAPQDQSTIMYGNKGAAYIYNSGTNNSWSLVKCAYANYGIINLRYGTSVDIANDRAVIAGSSAVIDAIKFDAVNGWNIDQHIPVNGGTGTVIKDVAIESTKIVYGELVDGGRVVHLERSGSGQTPWIVKSTVGMNQAGAQLGFSVDLAQNVVAAGVFQYDYSDIIDPCVQSSQADDNSGGAVMYNFDYFNGKFFNGNNNYRTAAEDLGTDVEAATPIMIISPNPAETNSVEITTNEVLLEVVAVSSTGISKLIKLTNSTADISDLTPGMYVLQIKTDKGISSRKLIVK